MPGQMLALGFGFVEVGTLTPRPRRAIRGRGCSASTEDRGGDQPHGLQQWRPAGRARTASMRDAGTGSSGSTSAPTRTASTASPIMSRACARWRRSRDYLTINISSPNTPGLRAAAGRRRARRAACGGRRGARREGPPIFLKVAPDLGGGRSGADRPGRDRHKIDALIIVSNTTMSRPPLQVELRGRGGGLSGEPLQAPRARSAARFPAARAAARFR